MPQIELFELKLAETILSDLVANAVECSMDTKCADCKYFKICDALCISHRFVQDLMEKVREERDKNGTDKS